MKEGDRVNVGVGSAPAAPFRQLFGRDPDVAARAPGRVNLIGEHTDYNGGCVLPVATPLTTRVEVARRDDRTVRLWSEDLTGGGPPESFQLGEEAAGRGWIDYPQGVTWALRERGLDLRGFDARIASDVPPGSGLSSSAALAVALQRALREAFDLPLDDVTVALLAQRAETHFVGAPVGVMDPMASSLAGADAALFLDTRTLRHERVPLPPDLEIAVVDSGIRHSHAGGEYRVRRDECARAAALLGVELLCELPPGDIGRIEALPDPLRRRARHVIAENQRVLRAVAAMRAGDARLLGDLFYASHASMRDDFEISTPEIDRLVDLARNEPGVHGARLTGGGFGGSVVILATRGAGRGAAERIAQGYAAQTGLTPAVLIPS